MRAYVDADVLIWHLRGVATARGFIAGVNDAILAATVRATGGKLYCLNTRHFPMDDILVEQAWTPDRHPSARDG